MELPVNTRAFALLAIGLSLAACDDAAKGADGADGADGDAGAAGTDGTDGTDGAVGADGADADCAGADPIEITGLTDLPADTLEAHYASNSITVESNAAGSLSYTVSGYGLDYEWSGDSFTVTPTTSMPSSQVIIATDGCTTAAYEFSVDAEVGFAQLNVVHLYESAPSVDVTLAGDDIDDAILTGFNFASDTGYMGVDAMPYTFDLWVDGAVAATTDTIELRGDMAYTLVVYSDGGSPATLLLEDDWSELAAADTTRITAVHVADGVGQVDVWETTLGLELFADLDFGTASDPVEADSDYDYAIGLDTDNDATADYNFQPANFAGLEDEVVNVFAFTQGGLPFLFASAPNAYFSARLMPDPLPAPTSTTSGTSSPALDIPDYTSAYVSDSITITDACTVLTISVGVDISHTYRGDLDVFLTSPSGTEVGLHGNSGSYLDNIIGTYANDGTQTLTASGDLDDFLLTSATGDWTLSISDSGSGDVGTLNAWGVEFGCL
jgi:subtilisin-like proprotein convertase family protein